MTPINNVYFAQSYISTLVLEALMERTIRDLAVQGIAVVRINPPFLYDPQGPWFSEGPCGPDCECFTKYAYPAPEQTPDEQAIEAFMDEREEHLQAIDAHMEEREGLVMAVEAFMEEREELKARAERAARTSHNIATMAGARERNLAAQLTELSKRLTAAEMQNAALQEENGKLAEELKESGKEAAKLAAQREHFEAHGSHLVRQNHAMRSILTAGGVAIHETENGSLRFSVDPNKRSFRV